MLLAPLAVLGLPGCFGKFTEYFHQRGQLKTFIVRIGWISTCTTAAMTVAMLVFPVKFAWLLFDDPKQVGLVQCLGVTMAVVSASNFFGTLMESMRQVRIVTWMRFITATLFAFVGTGMMLVWQDGAAAATIGFAISSAIGILPAFWVLWKYRDVIADDGDRLTHRVMWRRIAPFAIWLWFSNVLTNLFEVSDRFMLIHWSVLTPELAQGSVGQYHSGRVVPLLLISVAQMLAGVLMPYMSHAWEAGDRSKVTRQLNWTVKLVALVFTAGGIVVLLMSPVLFEGILQGRYNDGLAVLPLTMVYCIWNGLMHVGQDYLWVAEKGKWAVVATGFGLVLNIVLNMLLIPIIGLHGAVLATAAGNAAIVTLIYSANHLSGCRADAGIWLTAALPLILLLEMPWAISAMAIVAAVSVLTNLVFTTAEKAAIVELVQSRLKR